MQRIGRYEIEGELGRGGMGVVYRAKDPAIGRTVAIKTIRLNDLTTESERSSLRERLFREARSAGILSHPNIITIYDMGEENGVAYIAMEFVDGPTLEQIVTREGTLGRERIIPILRQTAEALDYAARNGIVHRDIKPGNIMLAEGGKVKVADFGVAKILSQQITKTDVVMGTPSYMSPEQIESKTLDGRSDQFALGVIAYELVTGSKPFTAENMASLVFQIAREEPELVTHLNPSLPVSVDAVIRRALSKQPAMRFPDCLGFVDALAKALSENPEWSPVARGDSGNAPTDPGTGVTADFVAEKKPEAAPPPPRARRLDDSIETVRSPGRRWLPWVLGAALAAAIAFVLTKPPAAIEQPAAVVETKPSPPVQEVKPEPAEVPKPSPVATPPVAVPVPGQSPAVVNPPADAPAGPAKVAFTSAPPGATVSIEGAAATCVTPCELELEPGTKVIRFKLAGHRMSQAIIEVPGESQVSARLDALVGTLVIKSTPPGAIIIVDGQQRSEVTPAILKLPAGKHHVVVRKPGSPDEEQDVEIKDQVITNMAVNWEQ